MREWIRRKWESGQQGKWGVVFTALSAIGGAVSLFRWGLDLIGSYQTAADLPWEEVGKLIVAVNWGYWFGWLAHPLTNLAFLAVGLLLLRSADRRRVEPLPLF